MKYMIAVAASLVSALTFAGESVNPGESAAQAKLDVAKVISITSAQDPTEVQGLVDMKMVYLDSRGNTQTLDYVVLGEGRQNG